MKSIFLIGYMGSGKSSVGTVLAKLTGSPLHDMDEEIEKSEEMPIRKIFIIRGEHHFRNLESKLLDEYSLLENVIVSCGGGIILDPMNVEILKNQCYTVFLEGDVDRLFERVKSDTNRPNAYLDGEEEGKRAVKFREQYEQRKPHYLEASSLVVKIDGKTPSQIAEEIISARC